jgi:hypothetical protein
VSAGCGGRQGGAGALAAMTKQPRGLGQKRVIPGRLRAAGLSERLTKPGFGSRTTLKKVFNNWRRRVLVPVVLEPVGSEHPREVLTTPIRRMFILSEQLIYC